jgi:Tol biopolymer transport system component
MRIRRASLVTFAAVSAAAAAAVLPAAAVGEECPNAALRNGPSSRLPDCRAYELVSPVEKNSGQPFVIDYSPDGLSATMIITAGTAGLEGFPSGGLKGPEGYYTTQRTPSGWQTVGAEPSSGEYLAGGSSLIAHDFAGEDENGLTTAWVERGVHQPGNSLNIFERLPDRAFVEVGPGLPPTAPAGSVPEVTSASGLEGPNISVSADGSRILFSLYGDHWPFDTSEGNSESLYEYVGTGNTRPMLVGVDEAGALISHCGTALGSGYLSGSRPSAYNAISTDGRTIFFTASCGRRTGHELYARIDNGEAGARTVDISEPAGLDCAACDTEAGALTEDAHFEGASQDGTKAFFATTQPLLGGDTSRNLYEYDFDAPPGERVVRVTAGAEHAGVLEYAHSLISQDGSHIYFLASGVLTGTPNGEGETAEAGANNLYVYERDAGHPAGRTAFVARLSEQDEELWRENSAAGDVTPDGRFLVFNSERDLTPDTTTGGALQVFEYDAQTGSLVRVSKGQDGFNHDGNVPPIPLLKVSNPTTYDNATNAEIVTPGSSVNTRSAPFGSNYSSSYVGSTSVSADGSYVFFRSIVGLTPQALDRKVLGYEPTVLGPIPQFAANVYEYHDGRVSLISDGQDLSFYPSYYPGQPSLVQLLGTDESGHDVLFTTVDRLTGEDTDTTVDVYDARIDGGFPRPAERSPCSGESCQGPLSAAPTLLSPGSEFQAGGNPPLAASAPVTSAKAKRKAKAKKRCKRGGCPKSKRKRTKKAGDKRRAKR